VNIHNSKGWAMNAISVREGGKTGLDFLEFLKK